MGDWGLVIGDRRLAIGGAMAGADQGGIFYGWSGLNIFFQCRRSAGLVGDEGFEPPTYSV